MLIASILVFMLPVLRNRDTDNDATREQNIAIAKEQLAELESRLLKKDIEQEVYNSSKAELERSLYNDLKQSKVITNNKKTGRRFETWLILLLIPIIAIPLYLNLGNLNFTEQFDSKKVAFEMAKSTMPLTADGQPDVDKITESLQSEMESNPTDPKGWYMLGRAYMLNQRFDSAIESFEKSLSLRPDLAETMLSLADALSMKNNGQLIGRPRKLVKKALVIEPQNVTALWLSGMAASQEREYSEAIAQWQKVLPFVETKAEEKTVVLDLIAEAKRRLGSGEKTPLTGNVNNVKETQ